MRRNLIICCDGTNNQFGKVNTNVVRLVQAVDRDQLKQRVYYDPGVGTLPEPGFVTAIGKKLSDLYGLAFGAGLTWKVQEAYSYLMDIWEPGDRVFLFGFSRGAYTVRVLAGVLHAFGLLPLGNQNMVPYLMRLYAKARDERKAMDGKTGPWQELCTNFRRTFSRSVKPGDNERHFPVHFLGVWDTVSSVGWVWNPDRFPYTANNPSIHIARHAVSIDERRWFFRQNCLKQSTAHQNFKEYWFAGVHCDVGGGYPEIFSGRAPATYSGIWRNSFEWIVQEAVAHGLLLDQSRYTEVLARDPQCSRPWLEKQHESLTAMWWPAEFVLKRTWNSTVQKLAWAVGLGRHRIVPTGALIHPSALLRLKNLPSYSPPNLSEQFKAGVRALADISEARPYE